MLRWLLASLHLLAFGIGLGAISVRASSLLGAPRAEHIRRALRADNWWGLAALLWLGTGLFRLLAGTEKPTAYYVANHLFWTKVGLFTLVVALEIAPATDLIRWRRALARGQTPDTSRASRWAAVSRLEAGLVVVLLFVATAMARGYGAR